mmetsp:Transcript_62175/g.98156  ORF Transcript_62175/g.98156 Transcript_62175/m.98156 type:complete len:177 (+) Transcript_62175:71-601(+)
MAVIFGGLSGHGLMVAREFASQGSPYVVTTSKTGRTEQREDMQKMLGAMRRDCTHYNVRCDTSDGSAVADLMAELGKPMPFQAQAWEAKILDFCQLLANELYNRSPEQCDQQALREVLDQLKTSEAGLQRQAKTLSEKVNGNYSKRDHLLLEKTNEELETVRETLILLRSKLATSS